MIINTTVIKHQSVLRKAQLWRRYGPPARPTEGDIRIFERHARRAVRDKTGWALVLGATPELRDLLAKMSFRVTAVDNGLRMLLAMTTLLTQVAERENLVVGEWLTLPFGDDLFDLIIGDRSFNMLPVSRLDSLMVELWRVLRPEGLLSTSLYVHAIGRPLQQVLSEWGLGKSRIFADLWFWALYSSYDETSQTVDTKSYLDELDKLYEDGHLPQSTYRLFRNIEKRPGKITVPKSADFESLLAKYYTILSKEHSSDFDFCKFTPVYLAQKQA